MASTFYHICQQFGLPHSEAVSPLAAGLINSSYKVNVANDGGSYFLQRINLNVFTNPLALQHNYLTIEQHLRQHHMLLPKLIPTTDGHLLYEHENEVWRCFEFIENSYSPAAVHTAEKAFEVANCFGRFTAAMQSCDSSGLAVVLPRFHDLSYRYGQFETALRQADHLQTARVKILIEKAEQHRYLVDWFRNIQANKKSFPLHILHHDCKISNILFDKDTDAIRCPIDLDTTQPGLFFSDLGDMIRTMASESSEDERDTAAISIRPHFVAAITEGYLQAMAQHLSDEEKAGVHLSGSVLIYMQALRFLTDYLNGNVYYKTSYPDQNKDRAANQLQLLTLLQQYQKSAGLLTL